MRLLLPCSTVLSLLLLVTGCHSVNPPARSAAPAPAHARHASPPIADRSQALTLSQIRSLAALADQGNTAAAERLGDYYAMIAMDTPRAIACYRVGARHGSARCRHNMEELQREEAQFAHKG